MKTLLVVMMASLLLVSAARADFTDNFDGTALNTTVWTPYTAGTYSVSGGQLTAQLSTGAYANPLTFNLITMAAPVGDFTATMKCNLGATAGQLPQIGIGLFSDDHQSLVMNAEECDFYHWGEFAGYQYGTITAEGTVTGPNFPYSLVRVSTGKANTNAPIYLQISRSGDVYTLSSSLDGSTFATDWTGTYTGTGALTQLGMSFFGSNATAQNGMVDSFTVTPEPATMSLLVIGGVALLRKGRKA